jgi:hypothetical protein
LAFALRALAVVAVIFVTACNREAPQPVNLEGLPPTALVALIPSGDVERVDAFRWSSELTDAANYRFTVLNPGGQPVLTHETANLNYALNAGEMSVFMPGGYSWRVEALDANGMVIATSRSQLFDVR